MSHELQTPFILIQRYVPRTISRGDNLTEGQVRGLSTDEVESIRMPRILEELLLVLAQGSELLLF